MINVLIADDHAIFRQGLAELLRVENGIRLVGETADGKSAMALILEKDPDVAILDVSMPEPGGIEIAKELQYLGLSAKVIILTMHKDPLTAARAMEMNIAGYVLKDNTFEELIYAIKAVVSGGRFISPSIAGELITYKDVNKWGKTNLTEREKEVLKLIVKGLTNRAIAKELFISIKTVDTHRTRIMKKLSVHKTTDLVRLAIKSGLAEG
jgi:DNA-binding NarL/FixJ family response regulator